MMSPATKAELCGEHASSPAEPATSLCKELRMGTREASAAQAPEGAPTSRM